MRQNERLMSISGYCKSPPFWRKFGETFTSYPMHEIEGVIFSIWSSYFLRVLSLLEMEELKRREMVSDTFQIQFFNLS
jgi:hypothetical protein